LKRLLLITALAWPAAALAEGPTSFTVLNATGTTLNMSGNQDAAGNISHTVSGFNSGTSATVTVVVSSGSHAAGSSIGGKIPIPIARVNGGSGVITNFNYVSAGSGSGGATTMFVLRAWDKNPTGTTCNDGAAFVSNTVDDGHLLTQPLSFSPQPPASTVGDSKTYVGMSGLTWDYQNQDTTLSKNVYVCIVTVSADTIDPNNPIYVTLTGPRN
jgi:hypothetical protein